ncbi:Early nodulin-like protein 3 [Bienertia sinuspersici]
MGLSSRICSISLVLAVALLLNFTDARDHLVGGKPDAWQIPSSEADSLNSWASKSRFQIGDSLVWKYDSKKDSVMEVSRDAYFSCNTSNPIAEHKDGETKIELPKSGPYYFISGSKANCDKGEKLIVVVMAARGSRSTAYSPASAPTPESGVNGPAVAPTSGSSGLNGGVMVVVGSLVGFLMM